MPDTNRVFDWTEPLEQEFGDEPLLKHLVRDRRFCGIQSNMRAGQYVSLTLTISFLSKSEKIRRRELKARYGNDSLPEAHKQFVAANVPPQIGVQEETTNG